MADSTKPNRAAETAVAAHYALLLGIKSPWQVRRVDLKLASNRVEVAGEHDPAAAAACPECEPVCARYDHAPQRQWRHVDVMELRRSFARGCRAVRVRNMAW
jgi:transposase